MLENQNTENQNADSTIRKDVPKYIRADLQNGESVAIRMEHVTHVICGHDKNATFFFVGGASLATSMRFYAVQDILNGRHEESEEIGGDFTDIELRAKDKADLEAFCTGLQRKTRP